MSLLEALRAAASENVWSKGVAIARGGKVVGAGRDDDARVFRVAMGGARAFTVHLWDATEEWSCDCELPADPCPHAAAAAIASAAADKKGEELVGRGLSRVGYRLRRADKALLLERVAVSDQGERPLPGALAGSAGAAVVATEQDEDIERAMAHRLGRAIPREAAAAVLAALEDCPDLRLDGAPVRSSGAPVVPQGRVEDDGPGFKLRIVRDAAIDEVLAPGIVRCGDTLRPVGDGGLSPQQRQLLGVGLRFDPGEVGRLVGEALPQLQARVPVSVLTRRLPTPSDSRPRLVLHTTREADSLVVEAELVYGQPPVARVERGELRLLGRAVPVRDPKAEQRLLQQLGEKLGMSTGLPRRAAGADAVALGDRLAHFEVRLDGQRASSVGGPGLAAFQRVGPLRPEVQFDGDRVAVRFLGEGGEADPHRVVAAWLAGEPLVPLLSGGWAPLPAGWLAQHGHLVADLLAARDPQGKVQGAGLLDLARLARALDQPLPPALGGLQALLADFSGLPRAPLPADLRAELRPYQRVGVDWMAFLRQAGLGGVLADDMGLGKTIQTLCALEGRTLVVCPTSVLPNWAAEARRFRPGLRVCRYHGPGRRLDPDADLVLTSYALLRLDQELLRAQAWDAVVLDEAQAIKNPESQVAQAAFSLSAPFRLTLTGTPVENRLDELWSQLHFAVPGLLGGRRDFEERVGRPVAQGEPGAAARLRARIAPFVLRRMKAEVAPELPPRTDLVLRCTLSEGEQRVYDAVAAAARAKVAELVGRNDVLGALEALLRLRQAACHPGLVPGAHPTREDGGSSKLDLLVETLDQVVAEGHKALVFSQWTGLLDRVEPLLRRAGTDFVRLDGATRDREAVVRAFQAADGPPVFLVSLKAGGTGLNLTAADNVFLLDPWWNPAAEDQAADRAHRIGQDKPVFVHRLVAEGTVEERILELQEAKRAVAQAALSGADAAATLTRDDLLGLLGP